MNSLFEQDGQESPFTGKDRSKVLVPPDSNKARAVFRQRQGGRDARGEGVELRRCSSPSADDVVGNIEEDFLGGMKRKNLDRSFSILHILLGQLPRVGYPTGT